MLRAISTTLMRGGTSKGLFFSASDLPSEPTVRDRVLLAAMGSPDIRQIDGVGGGHPLTSKVAIVSPSHRPDADVDYLFLQIAVDKAEVSDSQNCGNMLAGVGPWAIENGLVQASGETTQVRIHMVNSGSVAVADVSTPDSLVCYEGDCQISGVPGSAAAIPISFLGITGATTGALLPTGNVIDCVNGVEVTCIDNGMPVVLMRAADFGKTGREIPSDLEKDASLKARIEQIRLAIAPRMNLGDVTKKTVPKLCLLSPPINGGSIMTQTFIPHRVHQAIGVLGAVSVATGCLLPRSVADGIAQVPAAIGNQYRANIEHPTGSFSVDLKLDTTLTPPTVTYAALIRTARKLMAGEVYVDLSTGANP